MNITKDVSTLYKKIVRENENLVNLAETDDVAADQLFGLILNLALEMEFNNYLNSIMIKEHL